MAKYKLEIVDPASGGVDTRDVEADTWEIDPVGTGGIVNFRRNIDGKSHAVLSFPERLLVSIEKDFSEPDQGDEFAVSP